MRWQSGYRQGMLSPGAHALQVTGQMTWQVTWSLILGFTLSAVIEALGHDMPGDGGHGDDAHGSAAT